MSESRAIAALVSADLPTALVRRRHPELTNRPLAVSRDGTLVAVSAEARTAGLVPGMAVARAGGQVAVVPFDALDWQQARARATRLLGGFSPRVESDGTGCWYVDLSGTQRYFRRTPAELAGEAAAALSSALGGAVRAGLASGKAVARMAARAEAQLVRVRAGQEPTFLAGLPVGALPGVGRHERERLARLGLQRVGDVAAAPAERLEGAFGPGARLWQQWGRGWDPRPVAVGAGPDPFREVLPVAEPASLAALSPALFGAAERLGRRLRDRRERAERLRAAVEFRDGAERARLAYVEPTDHDLRLFEALHGLTAAAWNRRVAPRRLVVEVVARGPGGQGELFGGKDSGERLLRGIDAVRDRFGAEALRWGRQLAEG